MASPSIETQALQQALTNYALILAGLTADFTNANTANLTNLASLATAVGCTKYPKPSRTLDGENFQWTEYQTFIVQQMDALRLQLQRSYGPFAVVSRGRS